MEPRKRPKASYVRFEADLPNECWQADMTHWQLEDGAEVEIINFIDDHSRMVVGCEVHSTDIQITGTGEVSRRLRSPSKPWFKAAMTSRCGVPNSTALTSSKRR